MMIIRKNHIWIDLDKIQYSNHIQSSDRLRRFQHFLDNPSKICKVFWVDKHHKHGDELHIVTSNATVIIINALTFKLITVLFARKNQIKRYYNAIYQTAPSYLIQAAANNEKKHFNNLY